MASQPTTTADIRPDFLPLKGWLAANGIDAIDYLGALLEGRAPAPLTVAGALYVNRQDVTSFRDSLKAKAHSRVAAIIAEARNV